MRNKRKRILSLVLTLALVFSSSSIESFASENEGNMLIQEKGAVSLASAADITAPSIDLSSLCVDKTEATAGDTVTVKVKVTDDVAVDTVKAIYITPETNNWDILIFAYNSATGFYTASMNVTNSTEAGNWKIQYIEATDTSNNSVSYDGTGTVFGLNADLSAASYTVTGTNADTTSPVINVGTIKADKTEYTIGDTVNVTVSASDNVGISLIKAVYITPQTDNWSYMTFTYDAVSGLYKGTMKITNSTEAGNWKIQYIEATDTSNNSVSYDGTGTVFGSKADLSAASFTVKGTEADTTPPVLDLSTLKADKSAYDIGDTVTVSIHATDNVGISLLKAIYVTPQTQKWAYMTFVYDSVSGLYKGTMNITSGTEAGNWYIRYIEASDAANNSVSYDGVTSLFGMHADLSAASFMVHCADGTHSFTAQTNNYLKSAATCTQPAEYYYSCSICGKVGTESYTYGSTLGHSMVEHKEVSATCSSTGSTAYWYCSRCGKYFSDEQGNNEIEENSWITPIAPDTHVYTNPVFAWSTDGKTCKVMYTCENDPTHKVEYDCTVTSKVKIQATCSTKGTTIYTATYGNDSDTKEVEDIDFDSNNHDWSEVTYTWNQDLTECAAERICKNDATHVERETVAATGKITKVATYKLAGETTYTTAAFTNTAFDVQIKKVAIERLICAHEQTEIRNVREATCTTDGYTGDTYCLQCGEKTVSGTNIAATGHTWSDWMVTKSPTVTTSGVETRTCSTCGATQTRAIAKLPIPVKGDKQLVNGIMYQVTVSKNGVVEVAATAILNQAATKITIPATVLINGVNCKVTSIGKNAFKSKKMIKTVVIGKNVTVIGDRAFYQCTKLTEITLPSKMAMIGKQVFYGCKSLKNLTIKSTKLVSVGSGAVQGIYKKATIKCPAKQLEKYKKLFNSQTGYKNGMKLKS